MSVSLGPEARRLRARLEDRRTRELQKLTSLLQVSQALSGSLDLRPGLMEVFDTLSRHHEAVGCLVALGAWLWRGIPALGLVIGLAMLGNLVAAGLAGTLVPLTLKALKLDPALASAVIVTTVTDVVGFGLFLGLATLFMPWLT